MDGKGRPLTGLLRRMARAMYQPFCSTDVLSPTAISTSALSAPRPSPRLCTMYKLRSASPPATRWLNTPMQGQNHISQRTHQGLACNGLNITPLMFHFPHKNPTLVMASQTGACPGSVGAMCQEGVLCDDGPGRAWS